MWCNQIRTVRKRTLFMSLTYDKKIDKKCAKNFTWNCITREYSCMNVDDDFVSIRQTKFRVISLQKNPRIILNWQRNARNNFQIPRAVLWMLTMIFVSIRQTKFRVISLQKNPRIILNWQRNARNNFSIPTEQLYESWGWARNRRLSGWNLYRTKFFSKYSASSPTR